MFVTYTITTPMMHDARDQAVRRAKAEGYSRISITSVRLVGENTYEITLVATR